MKSYFSLQNIKNFTRSQFEEACFANVDHIYLGNNTVLCNVLGRYKMYVDSSDLGISPHLIMSGFWESWLSLLFAQIIKPGDVCMDIGANFGYYSILMSELAGDRGRTISVEANPNTAYHLKNTSFLNGGRFDVVQAAISDKKGEVVLTVTEKHIGGATIKKNELTESPVAVPAITIDELVEQKKLSSVNVMKIDVEGVEPWVFMGMTETLKRNPDIQLIIEYSPSLYEDAKGFTEFLMSRFTVYQATHVDVLTELRPSDIPRISSIPYHTDLYLKKK